MIDFLSYSFNYIELFNIAHLYFKTYLTNIFLNYAVFFLKLSKPNSICIEL